MASSSVGWFFARRQGALLKCLLYAACPFPKAAFSCCIIGAKEDECRPVVTQHYQNCGQGSFEREKARADRAEDEHGACKVEKRAVHASVRCAHSAVPIICAFHKHRAGWVSRKCSKHKTPKQTPKTEIAACIEETEPFKATDANAEGKEGGEYAVRKELQTLDGAAHGGIAEEGEQKKKHKA